MVSLESLDLNSEKVEGFYKAKNVINDIAFGTSLFVFCDLNSYFQVLLAGIFSRGQSFFKKNI